MDPTESPSSPVPPPRLVVTAETVAAITERVRRRRPRVHAITSPVALGPTANMLLAIGAEPSLTFSPEEIPDFVASADVLLINLGMLDRQRRDAALTAIEVAKEAGVPWVLDPVKVETSSGRLAFARALMEMDPALVHANRAEFLALAGEEADPETVGAHAVRALTTLAVTGEIDFVTDGRRTVRIANGHPLMDRVTAIGCGGTAIAAAFRAVEPDAVAAACAAFTVVGVAGEVAAASAVGPGSFAVAILDALSSLETETILARAQIS
jgi:hydroxyethylthiazole kinase